MTKVFYFLILFLVLSSCKKEEPLVEEAWECLPCSYYFGSMSGSLQISLAGTDTSFINIPTIIEITEGENDSVNLKIDISGLSPPTSDSMYLYFKQAYWKDYAITDDKFEYASLVYQEANLNATCSYQYEALVGNITLLGAASGVITFETIR
jgi:hypothetical protein